MDTPQTAFDGRALIRKIIGVTTATVAVLAAVVGGETLLTGALQNGGLMVGFLGTSFVAAITMGYFLSRFLVADRP